MLPGSCPARHEIELHALHEREQSDRLEPLVTAGVRLLLLTDQFVTVPDPHIVDTDEPASVRTPILGDDRSRADDHLAADPRRSAEPIAAERLLEGLLDDGVVVAGLAGPAANLVADGGGEMKERVVGQGGRQGGRRVDVVRESLDCRAEHVFGHCAIMPVMNDSAPSPAEHRDADSPPPALAPDYPEARRRFRDAATAAGATIEARTNASGLGKDGEELILDVAALGPADAAHRVLVVSGTHGVEGYCGSALQVHWLTHHHHTRPDDVRVVFLHALNPHGFSWVRRVNEDNIDLNRNFVDFTAELPVNEGYAEIAASLVPERWDEASRAAATAEVFAYVESVGMERMQAAVSSGQYAHPTGLFYGGGSPSWSRRQLESVWSDELAGAESVVVLDLHTGLGPWGHGELISHDRAGSPAYERATQRWGEVRSMLDGESVSAALTGDWLGAISNWSGSTEVDAVAIEYGTVDVITVLESLRADAWLHGHGDPTGPDAEAIRAQVRQAFLDDDPAWIATCNEQFERRMAAALG